MAMNRPFQFSMARMFIAVTMFSLAACSLTWLLKQNLTARDAAMIELNLLGAVTGAGVGIGTLTGRPFVGVSSALVVLLAIGFCLLGGL